MRQAPWLKLPVSLPDIVGLVITGPPATKLRARAAHGRHYTDPKTVAAEELVVMSIRQTHRGIKPDYNNAFAVHLVFYLPNYRRADIDNLDKMILDACSGVIWHDDQQVLRLVTDVFRGDENPRTELVVAQLDRPWVNPTRR